MLLSGVIATVGSVSDRLRAYRFALDPTGSQQAALNQHAGAARWAYNHALATKAEAHQRRQLQIDELVTIGYSEHQARKQATVRVPSQAVIKKTWNRFKGDEQAGIAGICPWWRAVSTYAFQSAFRDADQAWQNFFDSLSGKRAGRRVGMPRFKSKGRARDSFRLHHDVQKPSIRLDGYRRLRMPRVGSVRLHDSGKRLSRALARGGVVQSVTVSRGGDRWYAVVLVNEPDTTPGRETQGNDGTGPPGPSRAQQAAGSVGVDLGTKHLATLSTGETLENPRHLRRAEQRLRRAQRVFSRRVGPDRRRGRAGSRRWHKARARVARIHHQVSEQRSAYLHQVTKRLATQYAAIAVEDLNVAGMTRTARGTSDAPGRNVRAKAGLNRSILDAAPGEFRRQLDYKTRWYGSQLIVIDQWFPSSKTCSACGAVKTKLALSERVFTCNGCGIRLDRDYNAACNIAAAAAVAPDSEETENARGVDVRPPPSGAVAVDAEAGRPGRSAGSPRDSNAPITPAKLDNTAWKIDAHEGHSPRMWG